MRERDDFLRCLRESDRFYEDVRNWIGRRVRMSSQHSTAERIELIRGPCEHRSQSAAGFAHLPATDVSAILQSVSLARLAPGPHRSEELASHPTVSSHRLQAVERLVLGHCFMHCGLPAVILTRLLTRSA